MDVKLFELRDRATCMPVMAVRLRNRTPREFALLRCVGYGPEEIGGPEETPGVLRHGLTPYVILCTLDGMKVQYNAYNWPSSPRTLRTAHLHIINHWGTLNSGDVVDIEYILGETQAPKASDISA